MAVVGLVSVSAIIVVAMIWGAIYSFDSLESKDKKDKKGEDKW